MQTKTVRVVRAFYFQGKPTQVDDIIDLPNVFAIEMIAAKKAEPADKPAKVSAETSKPETAGTDKPQAKPSGKGGKDAG